MRAIALLLLAATGLFADNLAGRVVEDHTGNPLASVEVKVYKTGQRTLAAHLETDTSGRFHADGLAAGEYRIEAAKANYIGSTIHTTGVTSGLVVRLVRCGAISGTVADAQGKPIAGATVYAMPKPADGGPLRPFPMLSGGNFSRVDEAGAYKLHGLPPGDYAVAVSYGASTATFGMMGGADVRPGLGSAVQLYPGNQRPQFFPVTGGEQYRNIDFAVIPGALHSVGGKVDLPDPKTRYWLALIAPDQPALAMAVAETKPDGTFKFEGISAGSYTLTASGPTRGYGGKAVLDQKPYFGRMPVSVANDVDGLVMTVFRAGSLSFIFQPAAGSCPQTAQITLAALDDFAAQIDQRGEINTDKEHSIVNLAPARYQVNLGGLGATCYQASRPVLDVAAGVKDSPVVVTAAAAGAIRGKLSGDPKPGDFAVALVAADPETSSQPVEVVFPGADGRFSFGGLRPGRYRVVTQLAGEASKARWVTDPSRMIEVQIAAGAPTEMELPAPKRGQ
jgi:5-hydroxyisourate hydrolase-like protein (transthyretin family)